MIGSTKKQMRKLEDAFPLIEKRNREGLLPPEMQMLIKNILAKCFNKVTAGVQSGLRAGEVVGATTQVVDDVLGCVEYLNIDPATSMVVDVFNSISLYNASKLAQSLEDFSSVSVELSDRIKTVTETFDVDLEKGALLTGKDKVQNILDAFEDPLDVVAHQAANLDLTRSNMYRKVAVKTLEDIYSITSKFVKVDDRSKVLTAKVLAVAVGAGINVAGKSPLEAVEESHALVEDVIRVTKDFDLRKQALVLRNQIPEISLPNPRKNRKPDWIFGGGLGL